MMKVGVIASCGITDTRGLFLGVVSIDCQWSWISYDPPKLAAPDGHDRSLLPEHLFGVALLVHNVLRSFEHSDARRSF
jgi:hypothetical protein